MGKQTLIHPVPLSVLRGSLEYCNWKFSTLKHAGIESGTKAVIYKVSGLELPQGSPRMDPEGVQGALQLCFEKRIHVDRVVMDSNGRVDAWLMVYPRRREKDASPAPELPADLPF